LHERGDVIICVDEKPNIQALERPAPTKPLCSGQITRHEFEYKRHGTVNLLVALNVYTDRCGHVVWTKTIMNIFFGLCGKSRGGVLSPGEFT
jgi:hypothetical protein